MSQNNLEQKKPLLLRLRGCWVTKWTAHCASWHTSWASLAQCVIRTDIIHYTLYIICIYITYITPLDTLLWHMCVYIHSIFWHTSWAPWYTMYIIHWMPYMAYTCAYISLLGHPAIHAMHTCLPRCIVIYNVDSTYMYICAGGKAHSFSHVDNAV